MMKKILSLSLIACLMLSLCACGTSGQENKGSDSDLEKITMVLDWTPNTNHTGLYVALEKGYYEEAGLDVSIIQPPEDGASVLVASGQAQFGIDFQDYLTPVFTGEADLPITAVGAIIQHNTSGIISLKGNGITTPKGMEGNTYATWDLEIEKAMLKYLVEKEGGSFENVNLIPSTVTDVVTALQTNVDCVWIYYAWDGIATQVADVETDYFAFKDFDDALDYYSPVIIANNDYIAENEEQAKAFMQATKKGYEYAIKHPEEAAQILLKAAPELDEELVEESQKWLADQYQADAESWGIIDGERWDAFYDWLYENGVIETPIEHGTGYTNKLFEP